MAIMVAITAKNNTQAMIVRVISHIDVLTFIVSALIICPMCVIFDTVLFGLDHYILWFVYIHILYLVPFKLVCQNRHAYGPDMVLQAGICDSR